MNIVKNKWRREDHEWPSFTLSSCTVRNRYSSKNHIQPQYISNLFLCISMEIFLAFFAKYCWNIVEMQSFYAIIGLIHVFSVINIRRGPQNGYHPCASHSGVKPFFGPVRLLTASKTWINPIKYHFFFFLTLKKTTFVISRRIKLVDCRFFLFLEKFKICCLVQSLTFSQMTNFSLFQTERVCQRQFQIWWKWKKVLRKGRKHWEKEKLLVTSNFSSSHSVFERFVLQTCKNQGLFGKGWKVNVCFYFQYADPVADLLDKWGVFRARLFRESCVFHRGNYVKVSCVYWNICPSTVLVTEKWMLSQHINCAWIA